MTLEIHNYRDVIGENNVLGAFDVYLGPSSTVTYPNFKVVKGKTGGWFIRRPSYVKQTTSDGQKVWGSYPEMSEEKWKSLSKQLTDLLKPFVKE